MVRAGCPESDSSGLDVDIISKNWPATDVVSGAEQCSFFDIPQNAIRSAMQSAIDGNAKCDGGYAPWSQLATLRC